MLKKILIILLVILLLIQIFHPKRNIAQGDQPNHISKIFPVSEDVKSVLEIACFDCHSNNTRYPWYSKVQPVDWWLTDHINEGKGELNFDEFATYNLRRQYHKLDEIIKQVKDEEMPLNSYTWIHTDARLNNAQKNTLINWAGSLQKEMKNKYPIDSLQKPKN